MGTATLLGSNVSWSSSLIDTEQLRHAAMSHNAGRTLTNDTRLSEYVQLPVLDGAEAAAMGRTLYIPLEPLSPGALRLVTILQGAWVMFSHPRCRPQDGEHYHDCPHRLNVVRVEPRALAKASALSLGGETRDDLVAALGELYAQDTQFLAYDNASGGWNIGMSRILSNIDLGRTGRGDHYIQVRFAAGLHDDLMAGRYQSFPVEVVRLLKRAALHVGLSLLVHPRMTALRNTGETFSLSVTGRGPVSLPPVRLGLGGQARHSPKRFRESLEDVVKDVDAVFQEHLGLTVAVEARANGQGLKLTTKRIRPRRSLVRAGTSHRLAQGSHRSGGSSHRSGESSHRSLSTNPGPQTGFSDGLYRRAAQHQEPPNEEPPTDPSVTDWASLAKVAASLGFARPPRPSSAEEPTE